MKEYLELFRAVAEEMQITASDAELLADMTMSVKEYDGERWLVVSWRGKPVAEWHGHWRWIFHK